MNEQRFDCLFGYAVIRAEHKPLTKEDLACFAAVAHAYRPRWWHSVALFFYLDLLFDF